jgi:hypothetical protein
MLKRREQQYEIADAKYRELPSRCVASPNLSRSRAGLLPSTVRYEMDVASQHPCFLWSIQVYYKRSIARH